MSSKPSALARIDPLLLYVLVRGPLCVCEDTHAQQQIVCLQSADFVTGIRMMQSCGCYPRCCLTYRSSARPCRGCSPLHRPSKAADAWLQYFLATEPHFLCLQGPAREMGLAAQTDPVAPTRMWSQKGSANRRRRRRRLCVVRYTRARNRGKLSTRRINTGVMCTPGTRFLSTHSCLSPDRSEAARVLL